MFWSGEGVGIVFIGLGVVFMVVFGVVVGGIGWVVG